MFTAAIVTGLGLGSMYALLALGFHLTWVVSRTVNFAQGSAMMVGAVLGYTFCITWGWSLWLALPLTLPVVPVYLLSVDMGPRPGFAVCLALSLAWLVAASIAAVLLGRSAPAPRRLL